MGDPSAIARSFLDAYTSFCNAGNGAGLAGLYGADSFAAYEGVAKRGQADIAANFIMPRMPVKLRFATVTVQATPVNTLLVVTNGESDKPAGRFTQVFVLAPTAAGGFYIRADVCRYSAGAAAQQTSAEASPGMGAAFVGQYFGAAASNRANLAPFYHPAKSQVTVDQGAAVVGQAAIMAKMMGAAGGAPPLADGTPAPGMPKLQYSPATLDSQSLLDAPVNGVTGATLVVATGQVLLEGESNPLNFGQCFLLLQEGGATYLANDIYLLNYA